MIGAIISRTLLTDDVDDDDQDGGMMIPIPETPIRGLLFHLNKVIQNCHMEEDIPISN